MHRFFEKQCVKWSRKRNLSWWQKIWFRLCSKIERRLRRWPHITKAAQPVWILLQIYEDGNSRTLGVYSTIELAKAVGNKIHAEWDDEIMIIGRFLDSEVKSPARFILESEQDEWREYP